MRKKIKCIVANSYVSKDVMFEMIIQMYENLYNQEILTRRNYDEKISSRITVLSIQWVLLAVQSKWFIDMVMRIRTSYTIEIIIFIVSLILFLFQFIFFYITFFRIRKNYKEVALDEIRMYHLYCANEKLKIHRIKRYKIFSHSELELLMYIKDSYQNCAFYNMKTNLKRGKSLILFDNFTFINMLTLLINYYLLYLKGDISWIL